ncbi:MAG: PPC domain-containing protein [Thermoguttaceae bacterium]
MACKCPEKVVLPAFLAVLALCATAVFAAVPEIDQFAPRGGRRGTEVEVSFSGQRLGDARGLLLYEPGIALKALEVLPDKRVKARLALASDCPLGFHALRLQSATGISNLVTFSVGALAEVNEIKPNSDFARPQKIALNSTVNGLIRNEEVAYYAVEAHNGQRLSVEVEGLRLGESFFDPSVAIMDTNRFVLAAADDTPLLRQDCACSLIVPRDGTYVIEVRESAFGGSDRCHYRLHVGTFPRPLAIYPAGGKFGQTLDVTFLGAAGGPIKQKLGLPPGPQPGFAAWPQDGQGIAPSPNPFRLSPLDNVLEKEPNNDAQHATPFAVPAALNGAIDPPGDTDCWVFTAKKGQTFDVRVFARQLRTALDSTLTISRIKGQFIAYNDDSNGPDSYVRFTAPEDDQYVISITDQMGRGGPEFVYRVEVTPVEPRLTVSLPERSTYVDMVAPVPKGNRFALMVSNQREDFGGDVALEMRNLPEMVAAQMVPIAGDQNAAPALLSAPADAKTQATLASVMGRHKEGGRTIEGELVQKTMLVRGDNNREVWNYFGNRLAAAVTEPVPFHVEIVPSKVPLVQNGNMELKVTVARDAGFKGAIALRMLYNPPGVSSPDSVTIPEGQARGVVPLTADGGAVIRTWKIAVLGESTTGDGPLVVSSQLADLEVAEPRLRFQFQPAVVEQGQQTNIVVKIEKNRRLEAPATIELLGLPNEVTTEPRKIDDAAGEVIFPVNTTSKSPPGLHKTIYCRAVVKSQGEPITHVVGGGELRIQPALPPKTAVAAKPEPKPTPQTKPAAAKPLSRLEQLRLAKKGALTP